MSPPPPTGATGGITASPLPPPGLPTRPPNMSLLGQLRWGVAHPPLDPADPTSAFYRPGAFTDKTVLVTGANTGLGFEAALKIAKMGCKTLILGVRSAEKGEATRRRIVEGGGAVEDVRVLVVEMGEFASVVGAVQELKGMVPAGLDVAMLCAGVAAPRFEVGREGWETGVMVNVLATAVMGVGVLPLVKGGGGRVVFVNSNANDLVKREWFEGSLLQAANSPEGWDGIKRYAMVKLTGLAVMKAVARKAGEGEGVVVNAVCPGMCKTDLGRNYAWYERLAMGLMSPLTHRTAEAGGRSLVTAALVGRESHGKFWHNDVLYP